MSDESITQLDPNTSPLVTDLLVIEDDPTGSPATQKITIADFFKVINGMTADATPVGSTDYVPTYDASASAAKKVLINDLIIKKILESGGTTLSLGAVSDGKFLKRSGTDIIGGNGGLTNSAANVTASNVTGVVGTRHILDVSGMTANRNFVLPAGTAGDEIEVVLSVGDATYSLIIIGDTGITLTGRGTTTGTATELTRIRITGESLRFVATSATNWALVNDGTIKQIGVMERQTSQSINNTSDTKIQFATSIKDVGNILDTATNYRITVFRAGTYNIQGYASLAGALDDNESMEVYIYVNGALVKVGNSYTATAGTNRLGFITIFATLSLAAGDYIELNVWHNEGSAVNTNTTYYPQLAVFEL